MRVTRNYYAVEKVDADHEFDFLQTNMPDFKDYFKRPMGTIIFLEKYKGRLDLMSHEVYRTCHFWWALALANDIDDPFDESHLDTLMRIPDILDIYEFYDANFVNTDDLKKDIADAIGNI